MFTFPINTNHMQITRSNCADKCPIRQFSGSDCVQRDGFSPTRLSPSPQPPCHHEYPDLQLMSKPVQDVARPPLTQVLNTLPSPLTVSLVGLGPALGRVRRLLEILSWKSSWEESWLALSFWWVVCLCSDIVLR